MTETAATTPGGQEGGREEEEGKEEQADNCRTVQFSSVQSLDRLGGRGDMSDDPVEILL